MTNNQTRHDYRGAERVHRILDTLSGKSFSDLKEEERRIKQWEEERGRESEAWVFSSLFEMGDLLARFRATDRNSFEDELFQDIVLELLPELRVGKLWSMGIQVKSSEEGIIGFRKRIWNQILKSHSAWKPWDKAESYRDEMIDTWLKANRILVVNPRRFAYEREMINFIRDRIGEIINFWRNTALMDIRRYNPRV